MSQAHVLPKIDYRKRLDRASDLLAGGALLVTSQPTYARNRSVGHPYRQDSFLYYLTGFAEQESALVLAPHRSSGDRVHLFLRDKDPHHELWEGRRLGVQMAKQSLAIDQAWPISDLWTKLPELLEGASQVWFNLGRDRLDDEKFLASLKTHRQKRGRTIAANLPVFDADQIAGELRLRKSDDEVARMRQAASITRRAFESVFRAVRPGMGENEVHGMLVGEFLRLGAEMEAYGAIVAGGANACILHYKENNHPLVDGQLLLIDSGSQFGYYASDVTRTFPIGRKFSAEQKALYEVVLEAQHRSIALSKPGSSLKAIHDASVACLSDGLIALGLLKASRDEVQEKQLWRKYYPHQTSHWIGMDVHDVGDYVVAGQPRPLEPGMYFSVEPGLYVDPQDHTVAEGFRGIGIRIEDDVLITAQGHEVLTQGIIKRVDELESRLG